MSEIVQYSEAMLVERLGALVAAGGSPRRAAKRLAEQGVKVDAAELVALRDRHDGMYLALAAERAQAAEEAIAQQFREIIDGSNRLTAAFVDKLAADVENGQMPRDLERTVQALAKVTQVSTDKLLSLTGRPVAGGAVDPMEGVRELVKMKVIKIVERPEAIDTDAEEVQ